MRKLMLTAVSAVILAMCAPATALAFPTVAALRGAISPTKVGTTTHPANTRLSMSVSLATTPGGLQPNTAYRTTLFFPAGFRLNSKAFPTCTVAKLETTGPSACPAKSKIGSGTATGVGGTPGSVSVVTEPLTVTLFNGPAGASPSVLLYVVGSAPVSINAPLTAKLTRVAKPYSYKLTLDFPPALQVQLGQQIALSSFRVSVGGTVVKSGRSIGYIQSTACPSSRKLSVKGEFLTNDDAGHPGGPMLKASTTVACRR